MVCGAFPLRRCERDNSDVVRFRLQRPCLPCRTPLRSPTSQTPSARRGRPGSEQETGGGGETEKLEAAQTAIKQLMVFWFYCL